MRDDFDMAMRKREMGAALDDHAPRLVEVFRAYAAADTSGDGTAEGSKAARATLETINVRELAEMCEDCALFDANFTTMQLLSIFCKVRACHLPPSPAISRHLAPSPAISRLASMLVAISPC